MCSLTDWPPQHTAKEDQQHLIDEACSWALGNGLAFKPTSLSNTKAIHGPFALYPTPFPRSCFNRAKALQTLYNQVYANISCDDAFLDQVVGGTVAKVDAFQGSLYSLWKRLPSASKDTNTQDLVLGLFRSDYLLHASDKDELAIKQVEFNTISSSFGPLASKVTDLHRYLTASRLYPALEGQVSLDNLPLNDSLVELASGLAEAHKAYNKPESVILMVVQDKERNIYDQRALEWELLKVHGIRMIRQTFTSLSSTARLSSSSTLSVDSLEISVIYYRAGYTPTDYTSQSIWDTRYTLESSTAIKCPSVALQLAGCKKVQQVLISQPDLLERYLPSSTSSELIEELKESWVGMWPLDTTSLGSEGLKLATTEPERFVLKPQREGGGNNIYALDIPAALEEMDSKDKQRGDGEKEREGYVLMELIRPPTEGVENVLVRAGTGQGMRCGTISELGVYGVALFKRSSGEMVVNKQAGHLLRTKASDSNEGGVVVGASGLDSVLLV